MKSEVAIVMGSSSDLIIMSEAKTFLDEMNISNSVQIVSAHRDPSSMYDFASSAKSNGLKVIIAGAGGAAHLPGMIAAITTLPVIGVPIKSSNSIDGWDSILSILQMPNGIPVATVGLNCAKNAGILALSMLSLENEKYNELLVAYKKTLQNEVKSQNSKLSNLV